MTDLAIVWKDGSGDIAQDGIDMLTDNSLTTEVVISLFTDRRAQDSDELPGNAGNELMVRYSSAWETPVLAGPVILP